MHLGSDSLINHSSVLSCSLSAVVNPSSYLRPACRLEFGLKGPKPEMSAKAIFISTPKYPVRRRRNGGGEGVFLIDHRDVLCFRSSLAITQIFLLRYHNNKRTSTSSIFTHHQPLFKPFPLVMEWQDWLRWILTCLLQWPTIVILIHWMPFVSSVEILEDKLDLSRWSLKYKAFGHDIEFSWLARNMQPIPNQKIHWRSLEGLPNRGAVRFFPKGPSSCIVELTVSYEVPQLLVPVASVLLPFTESLLLRGLERFAKFAKSYPTSSTR